MKAAALAVLLACAAQAQIKLGPKEYFEAPGFAFLAFHNNYMVGYQGGLQMILHGERVLDSGDLWIAPKSGPARRDHRVLRRLVDRAAGTATVYGENQQYKLGYRLLCRPEGGGMRVTLQLDRPVDWDQVREAGLRFAIYPAAYYHKSYLADGAIGVFARQYAGRAQLAANSERIVVGADAPLAAFDVRAAGPVLSLRDERAGQASAWFTLTALFPPGSGDREVSVEITPRLNPDWRRTPVIGVSQKGYHPAQSKRAVLELDPREAVAGPMRLYRFEEGMKRLVRSGEPRPWGRFLSLQYAIFDFSDVRETGAYALEYGAQSAGPFRIDPDIHHLMWRPTLQWFLPVQMCHVEVREGSRVWHGACHLDDAVQAPAHTPHLDGYQQGARETRFADREHVPGLDWGGWHDAGDLDVPAGSLATTTLYLALAREEFKPAFDQTTIDRPRRRVLLHVPDGKDDLLQQIQFGVEGMLALAAHGEHVFAGIVEPTSAAYSHVGDPVNVTDNQPGNADDRWVFTNRNTGLQYRVAQSLAAASRALRGFDDALAGRALATARRLWEYEQKTPPVYAPNAYVPRDSGWGREEIEASAELALTDPAGPYAERLAALASRLHAVTPEQFGQGPGYTLVRALERVPGEAYAKAVRRLAEGWSKLAAARAARNPYGVHYGEDVLNPEWKLEERSGIHSGFVWGHGWRLQSAAVAQYYFHKHLPALFGAEPVLATVNFVLGCHPVNNRSFVTGVGADSAEVAYGINRNDWTGIPGGVISGVSLVKPDFLELKLFPYLWYQTEYVIGGAGSYVFNVLAARELLRGK
jgi:hypothetical protein